MFYHFGGITTTSFLLQIATGFSTTFYYRPTVSEAFISVQFISISALLFGWFTRSLHRWTSGIISLSLITHVLRVYLTGGFKKPRELIWVTGTFLAVQTLSFGVTGYSLPWDQIGFWACKIVTALPQSLDDIVPRLGFFFLDTLRGSFSVGQSSLTRFYSLHTFVLPIITLTLLLSHFSILRKQGISNLP